MTGLMDQSSHTEKGRILDQRFSERLEVFQTQSDIVVDEVDELNRGWKQLDRGVSLPGLCGGGLVPVILEGPFFRPGRDYMGGVVGFIRVASIDHQNQPLLGAGLRRHAPESFLQLSGAVARADDDGLGRGPEPVGHRATLCG